MSSSSEDYQDVFFKEDIAIDQSLQKNVEGSIIASSKQQQSQKSNRNDEQSKKSQNSLVQKVNGKQQRKELTGQLIETNDLNTITFQKHFNKIQSSVSNKTSFQDKKQKINDEPGISNQNTQSQQSQPNKKSKKQFQRSEFKSIRRSLHVIPTKNEKKKVIPDKLVFDRFNKRVISQQNSYRRYNVEDNSQNHSSKQSQLPQNKYGKIFNKQNISTHSSTKNYRFSQNKNLSKRYQSQSLSKLDDQDLYNHPQRNFQRLVMFLKTYVISPFQSVSIQVSILKNSLIIIANLFGQSNETIKSVLSQQKTQKLLMESYNDWQILGKRVFLEMTPSGGKRIKISPIKQMLDFVQAKQVRQKLDFKKQKQPPGEYMRLLRENRIRERFQRQKDFIRRNYYSLVKREDITKNRRTSTTNYPETEIFLPHSKGTLLNKESRKESTIKKSSTIQTNKAQETITTICNKTSNNFRRTSYFSQSRHINYLSPEVKEQVERYKNQQEDLQLKDRQKEQERVRKQAFLKKQQAFIQRLSKSKSREKDKNALQIQLKKEKSKSKQKPFVVFKIGSVNNLAYMSLLPGRGQSRVLSRRQEYRNKNDPKILIADKPYTQTKEKEDILSKEVNKNNLDIIKGQNNIEEIQLELESTKKLERNKRTSLKTFQRIKDEYQQKSNCQGNNKAQQMQHKVPDINEEEDYDFQSEQQNYFQQNQFQDGEQSIQQFYQSSNQYQLSVYQLQEEVQNQ